MKDKADRQAALLKLVSERELSSQEEMVKQLEEFGFSSTQSSISRDVRELGLVRLNGRYVPATRLEAEEADSNLAARVGELIIKSEPVGANLVVLRTPPGAANAVAVQLDRALSGETVGTIAGDDTIFVAVRSRASQGRVMAFLASARKAKANAQSVQSAATATAPTATEEPAEVGADAAAGTVQ